MTDDDKSLGDDATLGGENADGQVDPRSLGDQPTHGGASGVDSVGDSSSLGDQLTFGGDESGEALNDGMEIVDLENRYTIERVLGKGGMGEVLLATDTRLERKVAIKRILGKAARSKTAVNRFLTEAKSVAALNHPNIVQVYDYGRDKQGPFLIMEYVAGESLLERCKHGAIGLAESIELTVQLCDGLAAAHDAHIVHRDVKPANILLTSSGIPKLTDFGLAKAETAKMAEGGMTQSGAVLGTLDFMPPEQRKDAALVDPRSDLWSLAATLYQMVTGESPKVIRLKKVPAELQDVLDKALEDKKNDRYQAARDFKDALLASRSSTAEAELEEGNCPHCGTKNPTTRKFCRNHDCGESLEVPCLSCQSTIPMWDEVCDSCGAPQRDQVEQLRIHMASEQAEAESLLKALDFNRAKSLAVALRDEPDLRLMHLKGWAERFLPNVENERKRKMAQMGGLIQEAEAHQQVHDYTSALCSLDQVPNILRSTLLPGRGQTVKDLRDKLQSTIDKIKRMDRKIRDRVEKEDFHDLLVEVQQLQRIQPDSKYLQQLTGQLAERDRKLRTTRDEALTEAQGLMKNQDYDGCLRQLDRIDQSLLVPDIQVLKVRAEANRDELKSLSDEIKRRVEADQLQDLLPIVEQCLALKNDAQDLLTLRYQLFQRNRELARDETLAHARDLLAHQDYDGCLHCLDEIEEGLINEKVSSLRNRAATDRDNFQTLRADIYYRAETNQLHGLLTQVQKALELKGDAKELLALRDRLIHRNHKLNKTREKALTKAKQRLALQDHDGCLEQLDRIDASLVSSDVNDLRELAKSKRERFQSLRDEIYQRVEANELHGLLPQVEDCLTLKKDAQDLLALRDQLVEQEKKRLKDDSLTAARAMFGNQEYDNCLDHLKRIDVSLFDDEIDCLKKAAETKRLQLNSLRYEISQRVKAGKLNGLLPKVDQCLALQSNAQELLELRKRLVVLETKNAAFWASSMKEAETLRQACQFSAAVTTLQKMINISSNQESENLLVECQNLHDDRALAMQAMNQEIENGFAQQSISDTEWYRDSLTESGLHDPDFEKRYTHFQQQLQAKKKSDQVVRSRRALKIKLGIGATALIALFIIVTVAQRQWADRQRSTAIAAAIERGDFSAALAMDPTNSSTLDLKKEADIKRALSDGDYQAALALDPSDPAALVFKKNADIKQALSNGDFQTALGLDPKNPDALMMKEAFDKRKNDISKALKLGNYRTALELDPTNATALAVKKESERINRLRLKAEQLQETHSLVGHRRVVGSVCFSSDGKWLASGSGDGLAKIWDTQTGAEIFSLQGHVERVGSVCFSPDGKWLASGSEDNTIKIWDLATRNEIHTLQTHTDDVYTVCFSPDGKWLASGSRDNTVKLWNPVTGKEIRTLEGHDGHVHSICFSPDGRQLASGSSDNTVKIWDPESGKQIRSLDGNTIMIRSVCFSPDGKQLASGSKDKTIQIWNLVSGKLIHTLEGHTDEVNTVYFSPDSEWLASGSADDTIKFWDPASGTEIHSLQSHIDDVTTVCFAPNGFCLASGSWDKIIKIWSIPKSPDRSD